MVPWDGYTPVSTSSIIYTMIDRFAHGIYHIADVTHYMRPKTLLDQEASARGTSVYLVDRVVPMLPEKLSNNICSLRPNEEKLCFSAVFEKLSSSAKSQNTFRVSMCIINTLNNNLPSFVRLPDVKTVK